MAKKTDKTESAAQESAGKTMLGDFMSLLLQELKVLQEPWQKLSQDEQDDIIHRVEASTRQFITKAVKTIASDDQPIIAATLESVTVKDGYKVVAKVLKGNALAHHLVDAQGEGIAIVIVGAEAYMGGADAHQGEPDQRGLDVKTEEKAA